MFERFWNWLPHVSRGEPSPRRLTANLRLEALEERYVLDANYWIVPSGSSGSWMVDTNWSLGTHPNAGQDVYFDSAHGGGTCTIPASTVLPAVNSVMFGDWSGSLDVKSNLTASTITLKPRSGMHITEVLIESGTTVSVTADLELKGGSIAAAASSALLQAVGTVNVNGSSSTDQPTLGVNLQVGDGTAVTNMVFKNGSQPLVVQGQGQITVKDQAELEFDEAPPQGQNTVTAVSNGDGLPHSIILDGGSLNRANSCECYVGMGVQMNVGSNFTTGPDLRVGDAGPLHLTGSNSNGSGLLMSGGELAVGARLAVDDGAEMAGGSVSVSDGTTLTLGVSAMSTASMLNGATFTLEGTLTSHGGLTLIGGTLGTGGSMDSTINVDSLNQVWLDGAEIDVTLNGAQPAAVGQLTINGYFYATTGKIVDNVQSGTQSGNVHGVFLVNGDVNLASDVVFSSTDLNLNPGVVNYDYRLFQWTGARTGAWSVNLPNGWTIDWDNAAQKFWVHEP